MNYNPQITGAEIRRIRRARGLSQDVLSGLAGIGRSHLAMIESGRKSANVETLWRIAQALDMSLSALFQIVEQAHQSECEQFGE